VSAAHAPHFESLEDPGELRAPRLRTATFAMIVAGTIGFAASWGVYGQEHAWSTILQGMLFPIYVSTTALFYLSVHNLVNARWHIPLRRIFEGLSSALPLGVAGFLAIAFFGYGLYPWLETSVPWADAEIKAQHASLFHVQGGDGWGPGSKSQVMVWARFLATNLVILGVWLLLRRRLVGMSLAQDLSGEEIRARMNPTAIAYILCFAIGITFFTWDLLLALQVNWFSTMWGVYCFTSALQTFLCLTILLVLWLRKGPMKQHVQKHTLHDLGTWMVGWSCFCAYIGFSQFMLIWYANLDEETFFYVVRTQNGYGWSIAIEAILRWPVPFLVLMSQSRRTCPRTLAIVCCIVLFANWMDWGWIIHPPSFPEGYSFGQRFLELLVTVGFAGGTLLLALRYWGRHGLIPRGEPRLLSTINAEHLH